MARSSIDALSPGSLNLQPGENHSETAHSYSIDLGQGQTDVKNTIFMYFLLMRSENWLTVFDKNTKTEGTNRPWFRIFNDTLDNDYIIGVQLILVTAEGRRFSPPLGFIVATQEARHHHTLLHADAILALEAQIGV